MRVYVFWVVVLMACSDEVSHSKRILFVRGGSGTGGFVEGGTDDHLCDIDDFTTAPLNRGYGQLAELLRADRLSVEQVAEGPTNDPGPVDLHALRLGSYTVIVFGSNNAEYTIADAKLIADYVRDGGGVLFASDANWGSNWEQAPNSDQTFLTQFGLIMNQDGGGLVTLSPPDFLVPDHPILVGVEAFEGEGVSPCMLSHDPGALATPVQLAITKGVVRRNTATPGPVESSTADDASITVVEYGEGRVACHFDRNTFFNENGAGTSLDAVSNATYTRNLFAWLSGSM